MKIGIFGGSFNPPHKMHEEIANELLKEQLVDTIIFVPTGMKYEYKNNLIDNKYRLDMLNIIASHNKNFQVSDFECKEEVVYTHQTLDYYHKLYPQDELFFICGTDNLSYIDKWKKGEYLLENYNYIIIGRDTNQLEPLLEKYKKYKDHFIISNISPKSISSTMIREKIRKNEDCSNYIREDVLEYIKKNHLYLEEKDYGI